MVNLLSYFLKNGKYKMGMSISDPSEVEMLPTKERPMTPKFFPIGVRLGEPAEGSFAVCRSNDTRYEYCNGEWVRDSGTGPYSKIYDGAHYDLPKNGGFIVVDGKRFVIINSKDMFETGYANLMLAEDDGDDCDVDGFDCGEGGKNVQVKCQEFYDSLSQEVKDAVVDMKIPVVKGTTYFGLTADILEKQKTLGGDVFTCENDDINYSILVPAVEYSENTTKCRAPSFVDFAEAMCEIGPSEINDGTASQYFFGQEDVLSLLYKSEGERTGTRRYYLSDFCSQEAQPAELANIFGDKTYTDATEYVWHNSLLMLSGVEYDDAFGAFVPSDAIDGTGVNMGYVRPIIRVDLKKLGMTPSEYMEFAVGAKDEIVLPTNDSSVDKDIVIKSTARDVYEVLSSVNKKVAATVAEKSLIPFVKLVDETEDVNTLFDGSNDNFKSIERSIINITIPDGVTNIGNNVFEDCTRLMSVTIPDSVTNIGEGAFQNCTGLTSIVIPSSVASIGNSAFKGCTGLGSVTIRNSATSIDWSTLEDGQGLAGGTTGDGVTSIGDYAFYDCQGLTDVIIGDGVTSIGDYAFYALWDGPNMTITIPNSVTSIGNYAFGFGTNGGSREITINVLATTPPACESNAFSRSTITAIIVPHGTVDAYKADDFWKSYASYIKQSTTY